MSKMGAVTVYTLCSLFCFCARSVESFSSSLPCFPHCQRVAVTPWRRRRHHRDNFNAAGALLFSTQNSRVRANRASLLKASKGPWSQQTKEEKTNESSSSFFSFWDEDNNNSAKNDSKKKKSVATSSRQSQLQQRGQSNNYLNNKVPQKKNEEDEVDPLLLAAAGAGALLTIGAVAISAGLIDISIPNPTELVAMMKHFFTNPTESLDEVVHTVQGMGPLGLLYFSAMYTIAEIFAIPAFPLTASAGYLFGLKEGTAVVLLSASMAASASFVIGRTFLRGHVEKLLEDNPKFRKIDRAIEQEGLKLMLLLRLSPIFPFALSNYLYGASSVKFWPFFLGSVIGFTPGTIAYVYTGEIGKALTLDAASAKPWYVYAAGLAVLTGVLKIAADVATGIIDKLEDE